MFRKILVVVMIVMLSGIIVYADFGFMVKSDRTLSPQPDQALIVFMRPKPSFGKAIWTDDYGQAISVFDVSGDSTEFIGILYKNTKICYDVDPGEYTFMVVGAAADFMKAKVTAGKTYYVVLSPRLGVWKARFSFRPLRQFDLTSSDFSKWNSKTVLLENTPDSKEWFVEKASEIATKKETYFSEWSKLSQEELDSMSLNIEDGI